MAKKYITDTGLLSLAIDPYPEIIYKVNQYGLHLESRTFIKIAKKVVKTD
jgi:hypothetical protein